MATGNHAGNDAEVHRLKQAKALDLFHPRSTPADEENMREVDYLYKEEIDKDRFPVGRCMHNYSKVKRAVSKKTCHSVLHPAVRLRPSSAGRPSDMANKENELTCAEDVQGVHYKDKCAFPVNSTDASKMAGAGSKYSDYFTELSRDHDTMTHALFGRNLRLNVALTLWRRNASELVAYLIRIQDTGVLADCLPVLTKSLQEEESCVSIGCCVDLLPQVKTLLLRRYEVHLTVALHWVQSVVKKWWPDLSSNGKTLQDCCSNEKNVQAMRKLLLDLWDDACPLFSIPGTVGELSKDVESYLSQLR
ncbi:KATNB1-like protein 1 isoform X1 [Ictalurus furcatus]|uniref:KATNB1-like protein 1 isoform X1 n=1 Tax=Ictalurus furcatus TaxID=66913 RepID=UPI002350CF77|nr:KATNB1-like protein 1 isoform X1 [Ictalurus furcatus]XP_053470175.1 KATNB1-like protein 1 isoform X1 [Ictalurus furcatus]XP_053470176.1 KATNB1-like protein 1 isoform X1 [Ictalurus furcatus]